MDVSGLASGVSAISAGNDHTCALTTNGGVKCWGDNFYGRLGDNTTTDRLIPTDVPGLTSGVSAVSTGMTHTCAVTTGGGVKCWGGNYAGQVGDNTVVHRQVPVGVWGLGSGVLSVRTGDHHTCALTTGGAVWCWGRTLQNNGTWVNRRMPVQVQGLGSGVQAISAGGTHTCALTTGRAVKCWGTGASGELGDDSATDRSTPVQVSGLGSGVQAISAGFRYTCALTTDGRVKCWGDNGLGRLGDGTTTTRIVPANVLGLTGNTMTISAGVIHACATTADGAAKCWGGNWEGHLGDGTTTDRLIPVDVFGLSGSGSVAASFFENTTRYSIGNSSTTRSPIVVSGRSGNVAFPIAVNVRIIHPLPGYLIVDVVAPNGVYWTISSMDTSGTNVIGSWPLDEPDGIVPANGTWQLRVWYALGTNGNGEEDDIETYIDSWSIQF